MTDVMLPLTAAGDQWPDFLYIPSLAGQTFTVVESNERKSNRPPVPELGPILNLALAHIFLSVCWMHASQ